MHAWWLEVLPVEAAAQPPFDQGPIRQVRVHNKRHRASVPFAKRSRGFVWFFSFLAYVNELEDTGDALIPLLDEPGLSLHGRAQHDLLKLVDKRLASATRSSTPPTRRSRSTRTACIGSVPSSTRIRSAPRCPRRSSRPTKQLSRY